MPPIPETTIERLLDRVRRPSRYIGRETHEVHKDPAAVGLRICLAFPEVYEIGMSHLGMRILYDLLNQDRNFYAERAFCPWPDLEKLMRAESVPLWSLESRTPLGEFDIVGFSLQSEMVNTNVLTMLDLAGIPLLSRDRTDEHPIIIGGGPVVFNPEPMADFFDCFLIGDGEAAFPALLKKLLRLKKEGVKARQTLIEEISRCTGVYVPGLYPVEADEDTGFMLVRDGGRAPYPIRKALVGDLAMYPFPTDVLVPQGDIVHDRYAAEIARGCTEGCRFCQAGIIYRPVRERPPGQIVKSIVQGIERTGYEEASLTALSVADYSGIGPLARVVTKKLSARKTAMSVSSLRVCGLTEGLAKSIAHVRKTGFTIAPEAGTQRLRDVINKGITDQDIDSAARIAFSAGWRLLKLYFMIGLPTETDEDVAGIAETALRVLKMSAGPSGRPKAKINVAVASFIPKPHTPFGWVPFDDPKNLRRKQDLILSLLKKHRNIRIKFHLIELSALEVVIARGDRRLGQVIKTAWENGARFDEWTEHFQKSLWDGAFAACGIDPDRYRAGFPLDGPLPWDHIDSGVEVEFLKREFKRGLEGRFTHPCEKPYTPRPNGRPPKTDQKTKLVCYSCGLECDLDKIAEERERGANDLRQFASANGGQDDVERIVGPRTVRRDDRPARNVEEPRHRYRLAYGKTGWSRYLSHLELVRLFHRAFRRTQIKLAYSAGFHPHPKISFGPALPVGVEGDEEYLDFLTTAFYKSDELRSGLAAELPGSIPVRGLREIPRDKPAIEKAINTHRYQISFPDGFSADIAARMQEMLARQSWPIIRKTDRGVKEFDARPYVAAVEREKNNGSVAVSLELRSINGRAVKPAELIESLLDEVPPGVRIVRRCMGKRVGNTIIKPLDIP